MIVFVAITQPNQRIEDYRVIDNRQQGREPNFIGLKFVEMIAHLPLLCSATNTVGKWQLLEACPV